VDCVGVLIVFLLLALLILGTVWDAGGVVDHRYSGIFRYPVVVVVSLDGPGPGA
jgi:hypothetical protein